MYSSKIKITGAFVPEKIVKNEELTKLVDTSDEWIQTRTGVGQRHISEGDNTSDIAAKAAVDILKKGNIDPLSIELIIVATVSSDYSTPSTACLVQAHIGAKNAIAFDVTAACSGFVYGVSVADKFIKTGVYRNAIVIGAEVLSKITDWSDRTTCVLFGDGAAGAYLERTEEGGILCEDIGSDGTRGASLTASYKVAANAFNTIEKKAPSCIAMDGRAIFDFATRQIPKSIKLLLEKCGVKPEEINHVVPHQANSRIIDIVSRKVSIPMDKFYLNMYHYGNTSSASIPIALNEMNEKGMLQKGDKIILVGFGGGLTWGCILLEW